MQVDRALQEKLKEIFGAQTAAQFFVTDISRAPHQPAFKKIVVKPARSYPGAEWQRLEDMARQGEHLKGSGVYESWKNAVTVAIRTMIAEGQELHVSSKPVSDWGHFETPRGRRISVSYDAQSLGHICFGV